MCKNKAQKAKGEKWQSLQSPFEKGGLKEILNSFVVCWAIFHAAEYATLFRPTVLVDVVSENNQLFCEHIEREFSELTKTGNQFQIRHFEPDKIQLESNLHIDYFFYRMSCLIHLCVESLKILQLRT
ncbi:hypothetical protein [Methyloglobulus sp.]|uniref:hypothetical protein n=1 Tax=Methyloglobulus sp. TaxID=2518622 RepID=UPI0032B83732